MADRIIKVAMDPTAVSGLAAQGSQAKAVMLSTLVVDTLNRLNVSPGKALPFKGGRDNQPMVHDVKRWLDSLTPVDKADIKLLQRVYATLQKRGLV